MKYSYKKIVISGIVSISILMGFNSCKDKNTTVEKSAEKTPPLQAAEKLHAFPGKNRIGLSWEVADDSGVKNAVVHWSDKDSLVIPYTGNDSMSVVITNLKEGIYTFSIYLYGDHGRTSPPAEIIRKVYGDQYIKSLSPRDIKSALFYNGSVRISWGEPAFTAIGTQISYTDLSGIERKVSVSGNSFNTILEEYKPGISFKYRTAYLPVAEAMDTLYTDYRLASENTFTNPLMNNAPDPWVVQKDSMYYFTHTSVNKIVLYATKKMSELSEASSVTVWTPPSGTSYSNNIWAPELYYLEGKWYIYFTADGAGHGHRMFVLENSSSNPMTGTWSYKGKLTPSPDDWAIDGTILEFNQQLYFIWSGFSGDGTNVQHTYISKMSNPWTLEGNRVLLSSPVYDWETHGGKVNEGPEILKNKKGDVFLVYSASFCGTDYYCLGVLSLSPNGDPLNPTNWTKAPDPIFVSSPENKAYGPGHCSFFKSADGTEDWIVYHANPKSGQGCGAHRTTRMQQLTWKANGFPDFGTPVKTGIGIKTPSGEF